MLTQKNLDALSEALNSQQGAELVHFVTSKNLGWTIQPFSSAVVELAASLGLIQRAERSAPFTHVGYVVADSLREYFFWKQRGGMLHNQGNHPAFDPRRFAGKRVLELGCGFGSNLLTLNAHGAATIGVDVEPIYLQLAPILFALEGQGSPDIRCASAEAIPIGDHSQDVVLLLGALQYMDIEAALAEARRVLVPGGELITLGGYLGAITREWLHTMRGRSWFPEGLHTARTMVDSMVYELTGRRIRRNHEFSTSVPVYPTIGHIKRAAHRQGLEVKTAWTKVVGHELCMVARAA